MAFILTGASGFLWLIFWFWLYDPPAQTTRLSKAEYDYIHIDDETAARRPDGRQGESFRGGGSLAIAKLWAFFVGKFMTDGIWWFYLFWLPDLFAQTI